jgi:hypothetical protein
MSRNLEGDKAVNNDRWRVRTMDRTERLLLVAVTILHLLAQINLYRGMDSNALARLSASRPGPNRITSLPGVDPLAYRESFQYTTELYPFLPPDTVWLKRSD